MGHTHWQASINEQRLVMLLSLWTALQRAPPTGPQLSFNAPCCCCSYVTLVVSDSVRPHRRQPTRLPRPWYSPGKNTGVRCHFLLQSVPHSEGFHPKVCELMVIGWTQSPDTGPGLTPGGPPAHPALVQQESPEGPGNKLGFMAWGAPGCLQGPPPVWTRVFRPR